MAHMIRTRAITSGATPIALDTVVKAFPTVAQSVAHFERSPRFQPVTTADMLYRLDREGYGVHSVQVAGLREASAHRDGYQRHVIRVRRNSDVSAYGDYAPELIISNANDGSSAWVIMLGAFRFICENGIMVGSMFGAARVSHTGHDIMGRVADASERVIAQSSALESRIGDWRGVILDDAQQQDFAARAMAIRYGDNTRAPVSPQTMLTTRRSEDAGNDLWSVFNRVQENTTRGGFRGRIQGSNGKMRNSTMRPIGGIGATVNVNRALFDLAEEFALAA